MLDMSNKLLGPQISKCIILIISAHLAIETIAKRGQLIEEVTMASESPEPIERWTAKRRVATVVAFFKGETSGCQSRPPA